MTHICAVCQSKGGVGKTTITIQLGAAIVDQNPEAKVLLIDLDPQGHLTEGVGLADAYVQDGLNLFEVLLDESDQPFSELVHFLPEEGFSVVPSNYEMMLAEQRLYMARNREHKLKKHLSDIQSQYDWILIDCPPNLGNLTDNALNAAKQAIVPIQAEATSVRALELLLDQIESIEVGLDIRIEILAVIPNLVQDSSMATRILTDLRGNIPMVTPFELRKRVILQNAWESGRSIFKYSDTTYSQKQAQEEVMGQYRQLAQFLSDKVQEG